MKKEKCRRDGTRGCGKVKLNARLDGSVVVTRSTEILLSIFTLDLELNFWTHRRDLSHDGFELRRKIRRETMCR